MRFLNPVMESEGYFLPVQMAGVTPDKRYTTCYGFNFVVNARAPKAKQEALHDMYRFVMSDLVDCWEATAPFTLIKAVRSATSCLVALLALGDVSMF